MTSSEDLKKASPYFKYVDHNPQSMHSNSDTVELPLDGDYGLGYEVGSLKVGGGLKGERRNFDTLGGVEI